MKEIIRVIKRDKEVINDLLRIWESSVIETHTFLSKQDISEIKRDVKQALQNVEHLYGYYDKQKVLGFIGVEDSKIEMLFIEAEMRRKGIGKKLVIYSQENLATKYVDVNEQNTQAVKFYKHLGFKQFDRSPYDGQGRNFPILHLKINI